jgi:hypothetical protein
MNKEHLECHCMGRLVLNSLPVHIVVKVRVMVFNTTFQQYFSYNMAVSFIGGEPGENHRPAASHWHTLPHNVVSSTPHNEVYSNSH